VLVQDVGIWIADTFYEGLKIKCLEAPGLPRNEINNTGLEYLQLVLGDQED